MVAACAAAGLVGTGVAVPAHAAGRLRCTARMSDATPARYSNTYVLVHTAAAASVRTSAHYKTTTTTKTGTADRSGNAQLGYDISRATKGYRVVVTVTVRKGSRQAGCATSFVPR